MTEERLPPHDITAEEAVLGGVLIDPPAIHDVSFLESKHFFAVGNGKIFAALKDMAHKGIPIDYITIADFIGATNEQMAYLAGLMNVVPTSAQTRHYADIVWKLAKRRELIRGAGAIATAAWNDDDIDSVFDKAQSAVLDVLDGTRRDGATHSKDGLRSLFDVTAKKYAAGGIETGLSTGFLDLDRILEGMDAGLYVLAGRPGMGKSALEGCIRLNAAKAGKSVLSFNLEMPEMQSWQRLIAIDTGLDFRRIRKGNMTPEEWTVFGEAIGRLSDLPMWINDTPGISPTQMHSEARRHQAIHGLDLITVDYLQLVASNNRYGNRVSEVGDVSRGLVQLALSLDVPVLALSQLSRSCEQRSDKRPILSDLRDSGDIEQDATAVMFIYRDDYYNKDESERPNVAEVNIAKHRNGPTGQADLYFDKARIRFRDLARKEIAF